MRRPTVLLFDVDGTLVTTGGAGRRAIERAFEALHGRRDATHSFPFDGMTDRGIVRQALVAIGQEVTDARIDQLLAHYLECLQEEIALAEAQRYRVHPGMREAVAAGLAAGMAVGLGTGNVERGARLKLQRVGLSEQFSFGGFGDDHELRPELIRAGAQRGAARLGVALAQARVVVIGDTPRDIDAAVAIGAECIGVGTGHWTVEQLKAHGATWAFADLTDPAALDALLVGR
jgi:phosphoglycolate phosphatase-like HAD superfamily hydrolase